MNGPGDLEARIVTLEQLAGRLGPRLRASKSLAAGVEQDVGRLAAIGVAPPPTCTSAFSNICDCIPLSLVLHDSYYGDCTLTYDPANFWWTGCRLVPYPGTGLCPQALSPIRYTLFGDDSTTLWTLKIAWKGVNVSGAVCPSNTAVCTDALPQFRTSATTFHCPPSLTSWTTTGAIQGQIYPPGISPALAIGNGSIPACPGAALPDRLYIRDSVYGGATLNFNGILWTGCKIVSFPGYGASSCAAASGVAITYELLTTGYFRIRWDSATSATTRCPRASTCSTTSNVVANSPAAVTVDSCSPFTAHFTATAAGGFKILGDSADLGVLINLSETPI